MHRSLNSTQVLSKNYSRAKDTSSRAKMSASFVHSKSPQSRHFSRPQSSHKALLKESVMNSQLHESLIRNNKKLSVMIRSLNGFAVCLEDIDWIMAEAEVIISNFMREIPNGRNPHRIQIENIHSELNRLIERFKGLEKEDIKKVIPQKNYRILTENINMMNRQPDTICSFKCTDMDCAENEEDIVPSDFSKIKLPSVIKESASLQNINSSRYEHQMKEKQYEATIQMLTGEIESEKRMARQKKSDYEQNISELHGKLEKYEMEWHSYKNYAAATINKCKQYLSSMSYGGDKPEEIERLLDDLFAWENNIDSQLLDEANQSSCSDRKKQLIDELGQLEWKIKENKAEFQKIQNYRSKASNLYNTSRPKSQTEDPHQDFLKLVLIQASTIEHLI